MLVRLSVLEDALAKWVERGLGSIAGLSSQFDHEDWVSSSHGEEGSWTRVVEYEVNVLGLAFIIICVADGCHDAESSVGPVLHKRWSRMGVAWQVVD